jgi:hypothetical protein
MAQVGERSNLDAGGSGGSGVAGKRRLGLDRFSLSIALGALGLVAVLLLLVVRQPTETQPMDESRPAGVVHNFYLALMHDDVRAAYDYLSTEARSKAPYEQFARQVSSGQSQSGRRIRIDEERIEADTARVTVRRTRSTGGGFFPFSSSEYTQEVTHVLKLEQGAWKLAPGSWYGW